MAKLEALRRPRHLRNWAARMTDTRAIMARRVFFDELLQFPNVGWKPLANETFVHWKRQVDSEPKTRDSIAESLGHRVHRLGLLGMLTEAGSPFV